MDETPSNGVEALVRDAVSEQKSKGLIPTPNAVKDYILPLVERGDRKAEDSRLRVKPKPPEPKPAVARSTPELEREVKIRLARKGHEALPGGWTETRKPTDLRAPDHRRLLDKREAVAKTRMRKRLRLLWSKPDWRAKLMQVNPLAINGQLGVEKQNHAHQIIRDLIADSDRVFGAWLAEPKKKLIFT